MQMETTPQTPFTVSQLTQAIKLNLEGTFPDISLEGEISNFKLQSSGHLYFSLKDANAQIAAVMFRGSAGSLKALPKDGDKVIVRGALNVYPPKGGYQLVVSELTYSGIGALLLKLEELKIKIHKKGWFKKERKRPLPKFPKCIGVVTSPTGAVIQDIINVLTRRFSGFHLILNPVRVQGDGAAQEIAQAIAQFNQYELCDVIIVGRGGGSIEDLWAFNEEIVAEAIVNSKIPIISAVGHETDHCIADYVADVRAPTPSAAAEIVIAEKAQQLHHLRQLQQRLEQTLTHLLKQQRYRFNSIALQPIFTRPHALLGFWMQKLDDLRLHIDQRMKQQLDLKKLNLQGQRKRAEALQPKAQIAHMKQKIHYWQTTLKAALLQQINQKKRLFNHEAMQKRLDQLTQRHLKADKDRLEQLTQALQAMNPKNLLSKGYSILLSEKDGSVIKSTNDVDLGEKMRLLLSDGQIGVTVYDKTIK
jgi:exodeoxyribonuclease VII large subunit